MKRKSTFAVLLIFLWGQGQLWSQEQPSPVRQQGAPVAEAAEEDPRAAGEVPLVEREADQLATSSSSSSQRISEIQLSGLPLNGRSYTSSRRCRLACRTPPAARRHAEVGAEA